MAQSKKSYWKLKAGLIGLLLLGVLEFAVLIHHAAGPTSSSTTSGFDKRQYPTDQSDSLWVVVNKGRVLPGTYVPVNLVTPDVPLRLPSTDPEMTVRSDTAAAMEKMFAAANQAGIHLMLASGYRSYDEQVTVYNAEVQSNGQAQADQESARPGHSEHQTGLAADIEPTSRNCEVSACFADTPEGKWLAANCYKYGFIIRYRPGTQHLTGYEDEPWHVRYVGPGLASRIQKSSQTLEQYFGLPAYTDYPAHSLQLK